MDQHVVRVTHLESGCNIGMLQLSPEKGLENMHALISLSSLPSVLLKFSTSLHSLDLLFCLN